MTIKSLFGFPVVTLLLACGSSSSVGPGAGVVTAKATDPTGDTYGTLSVQWDLTALTLTRDTGGMNSGNS